MAESNHENRGQDVIVVVRKLIEDFKRSVARLERICGITNERIDSLEDGLDEIAQSADTIQIRVRRRRTTPRPLPPPNWYASRVMLSKNGPSTFVVGDVAYSKALTRLEWELLSILKTPTGKSPDHLVGFQTREAIVKALKEKHDRRQATARSVIVGIARLKETLGPTYETLVEWRRGMGYRLRVLP